MEGGLILEVEAIDPNPPSYQEELSYQWYRNGRLILGEEEVRLFVELDPDILFDATYYVVVSHSVGETKSDEVTLNFIERPRSGQWDFLLHGDERPLSDWAIGKIDRGLGINELRRFYVKISNLLYFPSVLTFLFGIILVFQNCSGVVDFNMRFSSIGISAQVNCVAARGAHACVVKKNLFYDKHQMDPDTTEEFYKVTEEMALDDTEEPLSKDLSLIDYRDLPLQPVHLPFLDDSDLLKNSTFQVLSYMRKPVYRGAPLKFSYEPDNGVALSQVTSY